MRCSSGCATTSSRMASVEQLPKMEGRQMVMVLAPKKKDRMHAVAAGASERDAEAAAPEAD